MISGRLWWLIATLAEPAIRVFLHRRLARGKELADRVAERRGVATLARPEGRLLWLHAASVGETISVLPLLETLCRLDSHLHVLMTTGSVTSQRLLAQRLEALGLSDRVQHQFVPLDVPRWLRRFLRYWRPQALVLIESELWPNLIHCAYRGRVPMALVNARLSARSQRGWEKIPGLARGMLRRFAWISARSDEDAERLRALGGVEVDSPGDLKASAPPLPADETELQRLRDVLAGRSILLAACTHAGEEAVIAQAHAILARTLPELLTVIAPRHPERGAELAAQLGAAPRRSQGQDPGKQDRFWVADVLGEMGLFYRLSSIVFMGNSLDGVVAGGGGHNPFEPARIGCAVATGPHGFNFNDAIQALQQAGAITITPTSEAIAGWALEMLECPSTCRRVALAGQQVASLSSGLAPMLAARLLALTDDVQREMTPL